MDSLGSCCQVCGGEAGKHNYYGANVCISCRGFFRRSVQSQQHTVFQCNRGVESNANASQCLIDSKSRKSCKKCRFERCLGSGMRTAWVLTEEERKARLLKRSNKQLSMGHGTRDPQHQPSMETVKNSVDRPLGLPRFTAEERRQVDKLTQLIYTFAYHRYYQMFGEDPKLFHAWLGAVYRGQPMSYSMLKKIEAIDVEAMVERGYTILEDVLKNDVSCRFQADLKMSLVRSNHRLLLGFYMSAFCESRDMDEFMTEFVGWGRQNPHMAGVQAVQKEIQRINFTPSGLKSAWNYNVMYRSPWAPSADIEDRHFKMSASICQWPRQEGDNTIDKSQLVLLTMVLLLSAPPSVDNTERDPFDTTYTSTCRSYENVRMVEHKQIHYLLMLYRYLQDKYAEGRGEKAATPKFADGVQIISKAREVYEMHQRMLPDNFPEEENNIIFDF